MGGIRFKFILIVLASALLIPLGGFSSGPDLDMDKLVLAFYYPWYRTLERSGYCTWTKPAVRMEGGSQQYGVGYEEVDEQCAKNMNSPHMPGLVLERDNGETYKAVWENVIAADPDGVLVTSFNEWFAKIEK